MTPVKRHLGRPRVNPLPRQEQLRLAKRRQRQRERELGLETVQVKLPAPYGALLRQVAANPSLRRQLETLLARLTRSPSERAILPASIRLADYPQLRLLAWSRDPGLRTITAEDALALYERNWRFVDPSSLSRKEAALIRRLAERAGAGRLHVPGIGLP